MKLHLAGQTGDNLFTGYGAGYVTINQARYEKSVVVLSDRIIEERLPSQVAGLTSGDFEFLLGLKPEIVLLGSGESLQFPARELSRCLPLAGVGLEVMNTSAACRTYNVLTAEGRRVLAALLIA